MYDKGKEMFTIRTATGKEFDSDYATHISSPPLAFIRIIGEQKNVIDRIFSDPNELPIEGYEEFRHLVEVRQESNSIKITLEP